MTTLQLIGVIAAVLGARYNTIVMIGGLILLVIEKLI